MQHKQGSSFILRTIRHADFHFITSSEYAATLCLPAIQPPVPVMRGKPPENKSTRVQWVDNKTKIMCVDSGTRFSPLFSFFFFFQIKVVKTNVFETERNCCKCASHKRGLYTISNLAVCGKIMMFHISVFYCSFC